MGLMSDPALIKQPGAGGERFCMRSQVLRGAWAMVDFPVSCLGCSALGSGCSFSSVEVVIEVF